MARGLSYLKHKLDDPSYLDLHMQAVAALARVEAADWYDARFLHLFEAAKLYLSWVNPGSLAAFRDGFGPIQGDPSFKPIAINALFDAQTHASIAELAANMPQELLEHHETADFGRLVVHDYPRFNALQAELLEQVEAMVGRKLAIGYNFLSLYGGSGQCEMHMDEPVSMYTLDYCIAQSQDWPIHISRVIDWPSSTDIAAFDPDAVKAAGSNSFAPHILQPNNALIFNGSSQWHYRSPIPEGATCSLLFFHYYPEGCEGLVYPSRWASHFDIPELTVFCDLIEDDRPEAVCDAKNDALDGCD